MTVALVNWDIGLLILGAWGVIAALAGVGIGKFLHHSQPPSDVSYSRTPVSVDPSSPLEQERVRIIECAQRAHAAAARASQRRMG